MSDLFRRPKTTVRGVPDKVLPQILDQRYVACSDGNRLIDLATGKYYVPERWLVERINAKLERAANMAMEHHEDALATRIRALKENL